MAWYNDYRPTTFDQVIAHDTIKLILKSAIEKGIYRHAYLFSGPKGTGKTSIARIFANSINKTDINSEAKFDIVEMDAASNAGVDDIRNLIELSQSKPIYGQYKIFIIDEVHMLSKNAMNAMLKIIEEPPAHLIFLLATTDPQKIIPTVLSRLTHLQLQSHTKSDIISLCQKIATDKNINITSEAIELIASKAQGSHRDSINLLETVAGYSLEKYDADIVASLLSITPKHIFDELIGLINNSTSRVDLIKGFRKIDVSVKNLGINGSNFLIEFLHYCLESNFENNHEPVAIDIIIDLTNLISQNLPIFDTTSALSLIELVVVKHSEFFAKKNNSNLEIELLDSKKNENLSQNLQTNSNQNIEIDSLETLMPNSKLNANVDNKIEDSISQIEDENPQQFDNIVSNNEISKTENLQIDQEPNHNTDFQNIETETTQTHSISKDLITKTILDILALPNSPAPLKMVKDDLVVEDFDGQVIKLSVSNGLFLSQINNTKIIAWLKDLLSKIIGFTPNIEAQVRNYKKDFVIEVKDEYGKDLKEEIIVTSGQHQESKNVDNQNLGVEKSQTKPINQKIFYEVYNQLPEEIKDSNLPVFKGKIENPKINDFEKVNQDSLDANSKSNWDDEVENSFDFE
jgi:DNA polymerase-3 subunit gamma/tau